MSDEPPEQTLDVLRAARTLVDELSVVRDLPATLQAVVDGVAQVGFAGAVMNLVRADGDLEAVAVSGTPELHAALFGVVERRASWERLLAAGEPWGSLVYLRRDVSGPAVPEMTSWYPPEQADDGDWRHDDDLLAPMRDRSGALIGVLSVGEPLDRRRPGVTQRELLAMYAAHAAIAIENARLRSSLEAEKERFRQAFAAAPTGMAMISSGPDDAGRVLRVNGALCDLFGRTEEDLLGSDLLVDYAYPADRRPGAEPHREGDGGDRRGAYSAQRRYVRAEGSVRWFAVSALDVQAAGAELGYRLAHFSDITDTKLREERLEHAALHDPLTGLANRRALSEALAGGAASGAAGYRGSTLLYCDLDDFKQVNDRHGHEVGDRVLTEVGRRLQLTARVQDLVARFGGDEFVVLAHGLDEMSALRLARRLAAAVQRPMTGIVAGLSVTCSVGVAVGEPGADPTDLLARADQQLLDTKRAQTRGRQARGRPSAR